MLLDDAERAVANMCIGMPTENEMNAMRVIQAYLRDGYRLVKSEYKWCEGCKEHDQENHCCHRFSRVIRDMAEENYDAIVNECKFV